MAMMILETWSAQYILEGSHSNKSLKLHTNRVRFNCRYLEVFEIQLRNADDYVINFSKCRENFKLQIISKVVFFNIRNGKYIYLI